jgi:hypothetical protein
MLLREFCEALYDDWLALVSGIVSVLLAVWVAIFTPSSEAARKALWLSFAVCLFVAAYRIWAAERNRFNQLTAHNVVPHVIRTSSQVYAERWMSLPAVRAQIALKFENLAEVDISLKDVTVVLCERLSKNCVRELPIRGRKPTGLYQKPVSMSDYQDPSKQIGIAGLRIRAKDFAEQAYFYIDHEMIFDNYVQLTNGLHFLRLTVDAVGQKPHRTDVEVDWTRPGAWILSATAVPGKETIIKPQWPTGPDIIEGEMNFLLRRELKQAFAEKKRQITGKDQSTDVSRSD